MSKVRDTLFGDQGKGAAKAQEKQNAESRDFILQQTNQARGDINDIFNAQAQNSMMGGQAALDILRGSMPQQAAMFNQGQNNAMAAILGGQITPFQQPDFSFLNQSIPQYQSFTPSQPQAPQAPQTQNQMSQIARLRLMGAIK